ncbi:gamma-glutamyl cyclotransferase gliK [Aspergillus stella-maris]|uniref:gamma-glutamyl cyclotransferase gliK n=1 Tax=Aspergillus stella-maris TaxID=1810926 RepID=UPI003CCE2F09
MTRPIPNPKDAIWYFAYGSNIQVSVLTRRRITPLDIQPVVVPTHYLTFDIFGIPYAEPSFASVAAFPVGKKTTLRTHGVTRDVPAVHGLAYLLVPADYRQLVISEGGGVAYNEIEVAGFILDSTGGIDSRYRDIPLRARTLQAKYPLRPNGAPSARYLGLISKGCAESAPLTTYKTYIDSLPSYSATALQRSLSARLGAILFLSMWRPWQRLLVRLIRVKTDENGHSPAWLGWVIITFYGWMWAWHDYLHAGVWGRGDGVKMEFRDG